MSEPVRIPQDPGPDGSIRIAGMVEDSITDGPGLRAAVFAQGCAKRCDGCHNEKAQPFSGGELLSPDELLGRIRKNPLLRGITLSGGEPFCQAAALAAFAQKAKAAGYEIAAYTGYTFEELLASSDPDVGRLLSFCDVLVDGEFILARRNLALKFRGSDNQRILNVKVSMASGRAAKETSARWVG